MMTLTIRLDEKQTEMLQAISGLLEINTSSGTIKKMIETHIQCIQNQKKYRYGMKEKEEELQEIKNLILEKREMKKQMNTIQSKLTRLSKQQ